MEVARRGSRLSVNRVSEEDFEYILKHLWIKNIYKI
jgi:predicted RNA-binding protein with PUA-like domain